MSYESVNKLLADLHARRVATMNPADLAVNINQRKYLVDHSDYAEFLKAGDVVQNFSLPDVDGGHIKLDDLLAQGPVVLIFFRFAGCPACNLTLPNYERELFPCLAALGASLVAVSPQIPERLRDIKERHNLSYFVASDTNNTLARRFGIAFTSNAESQAHALSRGANMPELIGTGTWELPMPAAIVIGTDRIVKFANISPDWLVRAEASEILDAVRRTLNHQKAA